MQTTPARSQCTCLPQAGTEPGREEECPTLAATVEATKERTPRLDWAGLLRRTFAREEFWCAPGRIQAIAARIPAYRLSKFQDALPRPQWPTCWAMRSLR